jgi:predicted nucleic acid-binding protein
VVDDRYRKGLVIDASPLIYLAKIEAMEVFDRLGLKGIMTPAVVEETTRPALLFRHPDAAVIEAALRAGTIQATDLEASELSAAEALAARIPALHLGECEVLAVAQERRLQAVLFERRARNVARTIGVQLTDVIELLFRGTPDERELETRIRHLARLTKMRLADYDQLLERLEKRRLR